VAKEIGPLVAELLARNRISKEGVDAWAIHPGGPRILDATGEGLRLGSGELAASRRVLSEHGNCSSATILLVVDAAWSQLESSPGRNIVAVSFGPWLTLYAALLRTT
jgi:alkylresorcinol/alkylpyrone synthase